MGSISYIDTQTMKPQELHSKILKVMKNVDVYCNVIHNYYVVFPTDVENDQKDDPNTHIVTANTRCYDHETKGTIYFLEPKLIETNCEKEFIQSLKLNVNRALLIPNFTKASILAETAHQRRIHCTLVYKFTCKQTIEQKFCNAIMTKNEK